MIQKLIILATAICLFTIACKKDETTTPVKKTVCDFPNRLSKVVSYFYSNQSTNIDSTSYLMVYDANGKLSKRKFKSPTTTTYNDYDYFEYDAQGNCSKHEWKTFSGAPSRYYEYDYVDNKRSVTRYFNSISPSAPIMLAQTTSFFYTGDQLTKIENEQQIGNPPSVGTFSYTNGDKTVQLDYQISPGNVETTIYHFNELANPVALPELLFGYPENRLLMDSISYNNNSPTTDYQYEVDNAGRVTAKIAYVIPLGEYAVIERYYYDCKE